VLSIGSSATGNAAANSASSTTWQWPSHLRGPGEHWWDYSSIWAAVNQAITRWAWQRQKMCRIWWRSCFDVQRS
jgi:hypothetical protein